jgi:uncharacterized oxidoreductase
VLVGRNRQDLSIAQQYLPQAQICVADVSIAADRERLVKTYADINILVNNAGIQRNGEFAHMSPADIESELSINLLVPILLTHAYLPYLQKQTSAAVINVSSVLALVPKQSASIYCASKAGMHSFTQSLRWQLEGTCIQVYELVPPLVDTAMTAGRGKGKISAKQLADEFWSGFESNQLAIYVGKAKAAKLLARFFPSIAEGILRRG